MAEEDEAPTLGSPEQRLSARHIALAVTVALPLVAVVAALAFRDDPDPSAAVEAAAERMPRFESAERADGVPLSSTAEGEGGGEAIAATAGAPVEELLRDRESGEVALRVLAEGEQRALSFRIEAGQGRGAHVYLAERFLELRGHALVAAGERVERPVRVSAAEGWPAATAILSILEGDRLRVVAEPGVEVQRLVHLIDALRARRPAGQRASVRITVELASAAAE